MKNAKTIQGFPKLTGFYRTYCIVEFCYRADGADKPTVPRFQVGDRVTFRGKKPENDVHNLTVNSIQVVHSISPHVRLVALGSGQKCKYVEACQRFFERSAA